MQEFRQLRNEGADLEDLLERVSVVARSHWKPVDRVQYMVGYVLCEPSCASLPMRA